MENVMTDLETMSTDSYGAIAAIGAVDFCPIKGIKREFYEIVDLQSCIDKRLIVDGSTIRWWMKQSDEARSSLTDTKPISLQEALDRFSKFLVKDKNYQIWGNGSDFDNVILSNAYKRLKMEVPWPFWMNRCFRTIKSSYPKIEIDNIGTHHDALDDATWQAEYLIALVKKHNLNCLGG